MRYAIEVRKETDAATGGPPKPYARGLWIHVDTIEADCKADARRIARKRFQGQTWRINYRKSTHSVDENGQTVASAASTDSSRAGADHAPASAGSGKKAKSTGKTSKGKTAKKK